MAETIKLLYLCVIFSVIKMSTQFEQEDEVNSSYNNQEKRTYSHRLNKSYFKHENSIKSFSQNVEGNLNQKVIETDNMKKTLSYDKTESSVQHLTESSTENVVKFSTETVTNIAGENIIEVSPNKIETVSTNVTNFSDVNLKETSTENIELNQSVTETLARNITEIPSQNESKASNEIVEDETQTENVGLNQDRTEIPVKNGTGAGRKFINEIETQPSTSTTTPVPPEDNMITECETPNHDTGVCVNIKSCPIIVKQLDNKEIWPFIRASSCGISKDGSPKICCGKYNNFRNRNNIAKLCGYQKQLFHQRIIGGREASLGEYPWMALLIHRNKRGENILGCAGFLIHEKYVITAAHCTHSSATKQRGPIISVLLGEHNTQTTIDCSGNDCVKNTQNINTDKVTTHPNYSPTISGQLNDIAIIKLREEANLTDFVKPICLVVDDTQPSTKYTLSGWGNTEKGIRSKIKLKVEVPLFDKAQCIKKYSMFNITIVDTQICAGGEYQKDSCAGDSGGPLMMADDKGIWYASGIVSFGVGCGEIGWPGVYTNITNFLPWIKSQMT